MQLCMICASRFADHVKSFVDANAARLLECQQGMYPAPGSLQHVQELQTFAVATDPGRWHENLLYYTDKEDLWDAASWGPMLPGALC